MKGTVKFFDGTKGWGFITDEKKMMYSYIIQIFRWKVANL